MAKGKVKKANLTDLNMAERRAKVLALYRAAMPQDDIATALKISQPTVSRDIESFQNAWFNSALIDFDFARMVQLAKVDLIEREAMEAWQLSKQDKRATETENWRKPVDPISKELGQKVNRGSTRRLIHTERSYGDPRFLAVVQWCVSERSKLLGLTTIKVAAVDWRSDVERLGGNPDDMYQVALAAALSQMEQSSVDAGGGNDE